MFFNTVFQLLIRAGLDDLGTLCRYLLYLYHGIHNIRLQWFNAIATGGTFINFHNNPWIKAFTVFCMHSLQCCLPLTVIEILGNTTLAVCISPFKVLKGVTWKAPILICKRLCPSEDK